MATTEIQNLFDITHINLWDICNLQNDSLISHDDAVNNLNIIDNHLVYFSQDKAQIYLLDLTKWKASKNKKNKATIVKIPDKKFKEKLKGSIIITINLNIYAIKFR